MRKFVALLLAWPLVAAVTPAATVHIDVTGLRGSKGVIHACLTRDRSHFPDCRSDPNALIKTVPGAEPVIEFRGVPAGRYALAIFHDANANQKLDTFMGIPREGFGFSRNPIIRFGAPRFDNVSIEVGPGFARENVRLQYLL
jgi:uncharacterized protein (DUF2141 family)